MRSETLPVRHPLPTRPQRSAHSSQETASRLLSKPPHIRLVFRDPAGDLFRHKGARLGQRRALGPESGRQEEHQFLLLGWREAGSGRLNLGKSDHTNKRTPHRGGPPRELKDTPRPRRGFFSGSPGATCCDLQRRSACVGCCVALRSKAACSSGKPLRAGSYSGSFLRRVSHRLAWSRTEQRSSSVTGSVIWQQRLDRGQDRSCLLYGLGRTRQRRLGDTAVVGRLAKIEEEVIVSPQICRQ